MYRVEGKRENIIFICGFDQSGEWAGYEIFESGLCVLFEDLDWTKFGI